MADQSPGATEQAVDIAAQLREYAREKYDDAITTHINAWEDGDMQIEVYHTWVELIGGEQVHNTDYDEGAVRRRWFESWCFDPDGLCVHSTSYHHGDGPIYSKDRRVQDREEIEVTVNG